MPMRHSILYVGGSYPQCVAIKSLVDAGFDVHVADRQNCPPAQIVATQTHVVSATDTEALTTLGRALSENGSLFAYGIADFACDSVAEINRTLVLGGQAPDTMLAMTDKNRTKELLSRQGVDVPRALWAGEAETFDAESFANANGDECQIIVKPGNANASAGVSLIDSGDIKSLKKAIDAAAAIDNRVVIEEFLAGEVRNLDVLVADGEVIPVSVTRRIADPGLDFLPMAQYQEPLSTYENVADLVLLAENIAHAFSFSEGPFTVDYIQTDRGPVVLEVSPHFHSIAMEIHRGNGNPLRAWFRYLSGDEDWRCDLATDREETGAFLMMRANMMGTLRGLRYEKELKALPITKDVYRLKRDGTVITDLSAHGGLVGLAWLTGDSRDAIEAKIMSVIPEGLPSIRPKF